MPFSLCYTFVRAWTDKLCLSGVNLDLFETLGLNSVLNFS